MTYSAGQRREGVSVTDEAVAAGVSEVVRLLRERIASYGGRLTGEQNTKATLIVPILRALGWDVEDLAEVQLEYRRKPSDKPVDYALFLDRVPSLFIEAKALGSNLEDNKWANQIMGYATVAGVQWVVLTDGNEYRLYNSHAPLPVEEKLFRLVRVSDDARPAEATLNLLSRGHIAAMEALWRDDYADRQVRAAVDGLFQPEVDHAIVRMVHKRAPTLSLAEVKAGLSRLRFSLGDEQPVAGADVPRASSPARATRRGAPAHSRQAITVAGLVAIGVIRPPLELSKTYKGQRLTARIERDGRVNFLGQSYESVSAAAGAARASVLRIPKGKEPPATNGWAFWQFKDADNQVKPLAALRLSPARRPGA